MTDLTRVQTGTLTAELRRRGFVVCVFQPMDLDDRRRTEGWSEERKKAWLLDNARKLEDVLNERGNDAIDDLISFSL